MKGLDVKEIRAKLDITQEVLADVLGVSLRTVQNYEAGATIPKSKHAMLRRLLEETGQNKLKDVDIEYIKMRTEDKGIPYFDFDFAGGWATEKIFSSISPSFYIHNPEFQRCDFACNLSGYSISRRIPNNAIIGLIKIEDWQTYFPTNEIYAYIFKHSLCENNRES